MHFAIRYLTEYRYGGRSPTTSTRCGCARRRPPRSAATSSTRASTPRRASAATSTTSAPRCWSSVSPPTRPADDRRARAGGDLRALRPRRRARGTSLQSGSYQDAAGEFALPWQDQPAIEGLAELDEQLDAASPLQVVEQLCQLVPDRFEYRPGVTYVGSTIDDLLQAGAGVCQDFVHLSLVLLRRRGIAARYVSGYLWAVPADGSSDSVEVDTHAWLEVLLPGDPTRGPRRAGVGGSRPHQPAPRGRDPREDRTRALLRGRTPGEGPLPRRGHLAAECRGEHVASRPASGRAGVARLRAAGSTSAARRLRAGAAGSASAARRLRAAGARAQRNDSESREPRVKSASDLPPAAAQKMNRAERVLFVQGAPGRGLTQL